MLAIAAAKAARDSNADDVIVLDLREVSPVTDYFVICTGASGRQMATVAEDIIDAAKQLGQRVFRVAGKDSSVWVIVDFVDVVVHVFDEEHRRFYDLELMWGEAGRVDWSGG